MGVSVSASTAVLLVAAMISFGVVYSAEDSAQDALMQAQQSMTDRQQDMLAQDMQIPGHGRRIAGSPAHRKPGSGLGVVGVDGQGHSAPPPTLIRIATRIIAGIHHPA